MSAESQHAPVDLSRHRCDRWRRYGHDRLYVNELPPEGSTAPPFRVGYRDLLTGTDHPTRPQDLLVLGGGR